MIDELIRQLERFERGVTLTVRLPHDQDGYIDRQCPSKACRAEFKIHDNDSDKAKGDRLFCPICRHESSQDEWATKAQRNYTERVAFRELSNQVHGALEAGARDFNRHQHPGFISLSLSVGPNQTYILVPKAIDEAMRQRFVCEACRCRYASIGAAFFCPACGHNSALSLFNQTLQIVEQAALLTPPAIARSFGENKDAVQDTTRLVLEQCISKLVGAFERYTEAAFKLVPNAPLNKVKRGSFQRLSEASELWKEAIGSSYEDILLTAEYAQLQLLFQRRHLLVHTEGIVDAGYLQKSGDQEYAIGQRIVVRVEHVKALLILIRKLSNEISPFVINRSPQP